MQLLLHDEQRRAAVIKLFIRRNISIMTLQNGWNKTLLQLSLARPRKQASRQTRKKREREEKTRKRKKRKKLK